jgi:hypothetical protein
MSQPMDANRRMQANLQRFRDYWARSNREPLVSFCPGNYYVSRRYDAAARFLDHPGPVSFEMFRAEAFIPDYLRIFEQYQKANPDMIHTAAPFTGLPWIEAIAGCRVLSTANSFVAEAPEGGFEPGPLPGIVEPGWLDLYLRFAALLSRSGEGRFAVGQPILRGPFDLAGTLLGQEDMVYLLYDEPERMKALIDGYPAFFLEITARQKALTPRFFGGESMGFYELWCPDGCIWFQDDLTALLSPKLVEAFALKVYGQIASSYPYSLMHLHPASFSIVEMLLDLQPLGCIQVNKDVGGPEVSEMLPVLKQIQRRKNLVVSGDFTPDELGLLKSEIPPEGVYYICLESP